MIAGALLVAFGLSVVVVTAFLIGNMVGGHDGCFVCNRRTRKGKP